MPLVSEPMCVERDAPIPTWFGVGGRAERLARPATIDDLRRCVESDPRLRVLGDGANLLVDDSGVAELVVVLGGDLAGVRWSESKQSTATTDQSPVVVRVGAAAKLSRLILEAGRRGFGGLEGLGGIPATVGGAAVMNAGGRFGQIGDTVVRVHAIDRSGGVHAIDRDDIEFAYRSSGLDGLIITAVDLRLSPSDPATLRDRLRDVMAYKKSTQPLADRSAGCAFRNPTLTSDLDGVGRRGERVSAGRLIDLAGCKGLCVGGAEVSRAHGNFLVAHAGAAARDVIALMDQVRRWVQDAFGVELEREVVVWSRES
ncbi:MAG: UDP-N-acetylmuramate dehydrogenase [Phycisphaerales bacterium]